MKRARKRFMYLLLMALSGNALVQPAFISAADDIGTSEMEIDETKDNLNKNFIEDEISIGTLTGSWGTCPWTLDEEGLLTIGSGITAGPLELGHPNSKIRVKQIQTLGEITLTEGEQLFQGFASLESADLSGFDTAGVESMEEMFEGCTSLISLNLSGFNACWAKSMRRMFADCTSLKDLNLTGFNPNEAQDMSEMFAGCSSLTNLDLSDFHSYCSTNLEGMFSGCRNLISLDLSQIDGGLTENMNRMFAGCSSLTNLNFSNFKTWRLRSMSEMFAGCSSLEFLDLSNFQTADVQDMSGMFAECINLKDINLFGFNTSNVRNMERMFTNCKSLTLLSLAGFNTVNATSMARMFEGCTGLVAVNLTTFSTSKVESMEKMFANCTKLEALDLSNFNTTLVDSMDEMFLNCISLKELNTSNFDTSEVINMNGVLTNCTYLSSESFPEFKPRQVKVNIQIVSPDEPERDVSLFDPRLKNAIEATRMVADSKPIWNDHAKKAIVKNSVKAGIDYKTANLFAIPNLKVASADFQDGESPSYSVDIQPTVRLYASDDDNEVLAIIPKNEIESSAALQDKLGKLTSKKVKITLGIPEAVISKGSRKVYVYQDPDEQHPAGYSYLADVEKDHTVTIETNYFSRFTVVPANQTQIIGYKEDKASSPETFINQKIQVTAGRTTFIIPDEMGLSVSAYEHQYFEPVEGTQTTYDLAPGKYEIMAFDRTWNFSPVTYYLTVVDSHWDDQNSILASGTWGTCPWTLSKEGVLTIGEGTAEGKLILKGYESDVVNIKTQGPIMVKDCKELFKNYCYLESADLSGFNTSQVTDMSGMFEKCERLKSLDLSGFDTSNVMNMNSMFVLCSSLTSLDLSMFDTSQVTNMGGMFYGCRSLPSLDLSSFNTSMVTEMYSMFGSCSSLTTIDLSHFDTSSLTSMYWMFSDCTSLTSLQLSRLFNTSKISSMEGLFRDCKNLLSLDLTFFGPTKVENLNYMFKGCSNLASLNLSNFDISSVKTMTAMFSGCNKLTNLNFPNYNSTQVLKTAQTFVPAEPQQEPSSTPELNSALNQIKLDNNSNNKFASHVKEVISSKSDELNIPSDNKNDILIVPQ